MEHTGGTGLDFDEVYRRHADAVFRFCLSQVRDSAAAEDLAADVFAAAYAAYARTRPEPDGVRSWLFRIARNAAIDRARRAGSGRRAMDRLRRGGEEPGVEETAAIRAELRAAIQAIGRLGDRERALVGLRVAGGLSYAEIGVVLGMSEDSARVATARALRRVRLAADRA